MGTVGTNSALGSLLLGKTRLAILSLLFSQPDRKLYLRQIIRLTGAGQGAIQRELENLVHAGVLIKTREANLAYFQVNRAVPVFDELQGIVQKTAGVADFLRVALLPLADSIQHAFIYGSTASGMERVGSDVDLMVIGDVSFFDVVAAISSLQETLGREVNPTVFTSDEFAAHVAAQDPFVNRVMENAQIDVIGGARES
ncbi:ArsR family transcriptional regulator [Candidatus Bipolaricaulota bacterium]|nr:ArsR family transcriptional regulator [Candidatus Bipolaricaulota bacterium]